MFTEHRAKLSQPKPHRSNHKRHSRRRSMNQAIYNEGVSSSTNSTIEPRSSTYTYVNRNPKRVRQARAVRRAKHCFNAALLCREQVMGHCYQNELFTLDIAITLIQHYNSMTKPERKQHLFQSCMHQITVGYFQVDIFVDTDAHVVALHLCNECFASTLGVSRSTVQRCIRNIDKKKHKRPLPRVEEYQPSVARLEALTWIIGNVKVYGDYMPDALTVVLPVYSRKEYFRWFVGESGDVHYEVNAFRALLREDLPFICFRKCKSFTQCPRCAEWDDLIVKAKVCYLLSSCRLFVTSISLTFVVRLPQLQKSIQDAKLHIEHSSGVRKASTTSTITKPRVLLQTVIGMVI